jgi:two-component sensor histidine kinase
VAAGTELSSDKESTAALLLTELVTNAVRHGSADRRARIDVTISVQGGRLHGAVRDRSFTNSCSRSDPTEELGVDEEPRMRRRRSGAV